MGSACLYVLAPCNVEITPEKSMGDGVAFSPDQETPELCGKCPNSVDLMRILTEDTKFSVQRGALIRFLC